MKITFLDAEFAEATVVRGFWRWKRRACVKLVSTPQSYNPDATTWRYVSGRDVEYPLRDRLDCEAKRQRNLRAENADWQPVRALPAAKVEQ